MNRDLFNRIGAALYGTSWKSDLAAALGHNSPRMVRRWANDESRPIPDGVARDIACLAGLRARVLAEMIDEINHDAALS